MPWDNQSSSGSRSGGQAPGGGFSGNRGSEGGNSNSRGSGDNLGLNTGKTWHGNTAFGPAGGVARGYGTRSGSGQLGSLRDWNGNPLAAAQPRTAQPRPDPRVVEPYRPPPVTQQPIPPVGPRPPAPAPIPDEIVPGYNPFNAYNALRAYNSPYGPEMVSSAGLHGMNNFNNWSDAYGSGHGYDNGWGR